jgi:hypothetical protein
MAASAGARWSALGSQRQRDLVDTDQAALSLPAAPRSCTGAISVSIVVSVWCRLVGSVAGYGKMSPAVFDVAAVKRVWISGQLTTFQNALT